MKEIEKLRAGKMYCFLDEDIVALKENAVIKCNEYNKTNVTDKKRQQELIEKLFGSCGENISIQPNFNCNIGSNIHVGNNFLTNYNVTILDMATVTIGNDCMIGPNTLITTVNYPINPKDRKNKIATTCPVVIEDNVWIGGNCTILPGVTIGKNSIIAAGAVVTKNVAANTIVAGVPAKVMKQIEEE